METLKGNGEKILVVDDETQQRELAEKMLTFLGYTVYTLASGEETIRYMEKNEVDLVLLDMVMAPGMNGRETYEEIIALHPSQKTIISGFSGHEEVNKIRELGADLFVKKPFRLEGLAITVKKALQ